MNEKRTALNDKKYLGGGGNIILLHVQSASIEWEEFITCTTVNPPGVAPLLMGCSYAVPLNMHSVILIREIKKDVAKQPANGEL